jgi:hypothetical protein
MAYSKVYRQVMDDKEHPPKQKDQPSLGVSEFFAAGNIEILISIISASVGITTATIKGISLWIEERKSRRIKVKYKDAEIEIAGGMSNEKIEEVLEIFSNFYEEKLDEGRVKIIVDD